MLDGAIWNLKELADLLVGEIPIVTNTRGNGSES